MAVAESIACSGSRSSNRGYIAGCYSSGSTEQWQQWWHLTEETDWLQEADRMERHRDAAERKQWQRQHAMSEVPPRRSVLPLQLSYVTESQYRHFLFYLTIDMRHCHIVSPPLFFEIKINYLLTLSVSYLSLFCAITPSQRQLVICCCPHLCMWSRTLPAAALTCACGPELYPLLPLLVHVVQNSEKRRELRRHRLAQVLLHFFFDRKASIVSCRSICHFCAS